MRPRARPAGALAPPSPVTNGSALVIEDFGYSPAQMAYEAPERTYYPLVLALLCR